MTFKEAAVEILKKSDIPLSVSDIWNSIIINKLDVKTQGKTPKLSLSTILLSLSNNSDVTHKRKTSIFTIVEHNPIKFILIDKMEEQAQIPIKNEDTIIIDDDVDIPITEPFYKTILDDSETLLCIYNDNGCLRYETSKCNDFAYFFISKVMNMVKIGKTNNIQNRYNTHRTSNPDIIINFILPGSKFEREYQNRFDKYHYDGEWYFLSKEIKKFLQDEKYKRDMAILCYTEYLESIEIENKFLDLL